MSVFADIFSAFVAFGPLGMLVGLFVIVFTDAIVVPLGPELLAIAIYSTHLDLVWAVLILATVVTAQVSGTTMLYLIGKKPELLPGLITRVMIKYQTTLVINDEKAVFVNCFVPILPFLGAFLAVAKWDYRKSIFFVALGGAIKYSLFLSMSGTFHYLFEHGIAQKASLLTVFGVLVISGIYALWRRRAFEKSEADKDRAETSKDKSLL